MSNKLLELSNKSSSIFFYHGDTFNFANMKLYCLNISWQHKIVKSTNSKTKNLTNSGNNSTNQTSLFDVFHMNLSKLCFMRVIRKIQIVNIGRYYKIMVCEFLIFARKDVFLNHIGIRKF